MVYFQTKIQISVNFVRAFNGRCWYILWTFAILYVHLLDFMDICYILRTFGIFCGNLVYFSRFGMLHLE
jgi:hypothetical protein